MTARHDDDDLTVGNGQPDEFTDATESDAAPDLSADDVGGARDSSVFTFRRPVAGPVSPGADDVDGRTPGGPAEDDTVSLRAVGVSGDASPAGYEAPVSDSASDSVSEDEASVSGDGTAPPAADPSPSELSTSEPSAESSEPQAVSAAAFVWDAPEPAPTSPLSAARSFLRSNAAGKDTASPQTPRTPAAAIGQAKTAGQSKTDERAKPAAPAKPAGTSSPGRGQARATGARPKGSSKRSARQAHLIVARVEPWSVMKFSFVVSLLAFVILFVAVSLLYGMLSGLGVFTSLDHVVSSLTSSQNSAGVNASKWFTASRILGYTALLGSINIVLITAMSTIGAVIYNLTSRLIGGVEVTLRETD